MTTHVRIVLTLLAIGSLASYTLPASAQDLRTGLDQLAAQITKAAPEDKQFLIAVADFPDLQGVTSDLGRYIASRLTTRLGQSPKFRVIERQRLEQVLGELKFSMSDLVDPEKAKQLGRMAGVEAIVVGSVSDLGNQVDIDARMIEIETNQMILAETTTISKDQVVTQLLDRGRQASISTTRPSTTPSAPQAPPGSQEVSQRLLIIGNTFKGLGFLPPRTNPANEHGYWFDKAFDDQAWQEVTLPVNKWGKEQADFLARLRFDFKPGAGKVLLSFESDDGIWIYINGKSLGHWGGNFGERKCVNRCSSRREDVAPLDITSRLVPGPNIIAFRVHNAQGNGYFNAYLTPEF